MRFGIPTTQEDYTNDVNIYDEDFDYDEESSFDTNLYRLKKEIISAYKKAGHSNSVGKQMAERNAYRILMEIVHENFMDKADKLDD